MTTYPEADQFLKILDDSKHVVILQADNPDADSLASALALEEILGEMGKTISMYCSMDMPSYLRYLPGWDRVSQQLPQKFDAAILVDASTSTLLDKLKEPAFKAQLVNRPFVVLDHHEIVQNKIDFATLTICDSSRASTGELLYLLAVQLGIKLTVPACEYIMTSILGDTQGLTNELTSPQTYRCMAELVELGVERARLEELRREASKMPEIIFRYKGELISRTELYNDGKIGIVSVPQREINEYSPLYNPAPLIQNDILQIKNMRVSIVLKTYESGRITAAIRSNTNAPIANKLAEHFGGGGHAYASGFKIESGRTLKDVKSDCITFAMELLNNSK